MSNVTISILGDICPAFGARAWFDAGSPEGLLHSVLPVIRGSDLAVANLECPVTMSAGAIVKAGPNLSAQLRDLELLHAAGFSLLSIANNHIRDFGEQGVLDTMAHCRRLGMLTVGGGADAQQARQPVVIPVKGYRIGFQSFAEEEFNCAGDVTAGANCWDPYESMDDIRHTRKDCDRLIVLYHGGVEHYRYPSPLLQKKCRKMIDAGADVVICQHSHCIGTHEDYAGGTILYGQGNAVFGHREGNAHWNAGLLVQVAISEHGVEIRYLPMDARPDGVYLMADDAAQFTLEEMAEASKVLVNPADIAAKWQQFCAQNAAWYLPQVLGWGRIPNKLNRILKNALVRLVYSPGKLRTAMNLIRCDAHREVLQTILLAAQTSDAPAVEPSEHLPA